jgi:imidazolonepropionase-like amidohydrolase
MRNGFLSLLLMMNSGVFAQDLAVVGAKVYVSPEAQPITNATVLIRAGHIAAVGEHVAVPKGISTISCESCVVLAGFWNTHVHFTEDKWADAAHQPAEKLTRQLQEMLTRSGFTTVVDTASSPENTIALRHRIDTGEVKGPHIYTAGAALYPPHAIPYYLNDLPAEIRAQLPQPETPAAARAYVEQSFAMGTDIVKLFTGSYAAPGHVVVMPVGIARAAVESAHEHQKLVFAHPSNLDGTRVAMESGVDVLAHAPDTVAGIDDDFIGQLVAHHVTMIPTLKLFSKDSDIARIRQIVAKFHHLGGKLMFGTDTGFETDYDLTEEYKQLSLAGLSYRDVLAMLTTAPAERFHVSGDKGRIATGMAGDLTILSADPATDPMAFLKVRYTIRAGNVIADVSNN